MKRPFYEHIRRLFLMPDNPTMIDPDTGCIDAIAWLDATLAWDKAHPWRYRLWRVYVRFTQPRTEWRNLVSGPIRRAVQRAYRGGWCDEDIWSMDSWLCGILPPMLDKLRADEHGSPMGMSYEEWAGEGGILAQMAEGFRAGERMLGFTVASADESADRAKFDNGMALFHKWFFDLWD